jgi:mono/diheme cytochrome c family protein
MPRSIAATAIALLSFSGCDPSKPAPTPVSDVSQAQAATLFLKQCAICHGTRGDGFGLRRASLFKKPPDFRDPAWRKGRTPAEVRALIREGVPGSDMPPWKRLGEAAITGLADYVLDLAREQP